MYTLIESKQYVHLGPIPWNQQMFQTYLEDLVHVRLNLPAQYNSETPINIDGHYVIFFTKLEYPQPFNPKIEQYAGPFWNIVNGQAVGTYTAVPKPIDSVKSELKTIVADNRWREETKGITVNIQGVDVFITTQRGERDIFLQSLQLMGPTDVRSWKFGNIWLELTYTDMQTIVNAVVTHIQTVFDWDKAKGLEIDNAQDLTELDNIKLTMTDIPVEPGNRLGRARQNALR